MNKIANQFTSIEQITDQYLKNNPKINSGNQSNVSFQEILKQTKDASSTSELKFSKHAAMRMEDRNIKLSDEQNERLESGVTKASEKGINESLVMVDSLAFIVNVPNRTVVTAMDQEESNHQVFTNIDGAVIA
jgi:flagellar operon protein